MQFSGQLNVFRQGQKPSAELKVCIKNKYIYIHKYKLVYTKVAYISELWTQPKYIIKKIPTKKKNLSSERNISKGKVKESPTKNSKHISKKLKYTTYIRNYIHIYKIWYTNTYTYVICIQVNARLKLICNLLFIINII